MNGYVNNERFLSCFLDKYFSNKPMMTNIIAIIVSIVTLVIIYFQMQIASAKTKIDLYQRRFKIYETALDLYQATWNKSPEEIQKKSSELTKAYRESMFLFDKKHGIYETLGKIQQNVALIYEYEKIKNNQKRGITIDKEYFQVMHRKSSDARNEFEQNLLNLEQQLKKYIYFKNKNGWSLLG